MKQSISVPPTFVLDAPGVPSRHRISAIFFSSVPEAPPPPNPSSLLAQAWIQEEDLWLQMGVHHATVDFDKMRSNIIEEEAARRISRDGARSVNSMMSALRSDERIENVTRGGEGKGAGHADRAGCSEGEEESVGRSFAGETAADAGGYLQAQDEVRKRALTFQKSLLKMADDRDRLENGTSWNNSMGVESQRARVGQGGGGELPIA